MSRMARWSMLAASSSDIRRLGVSNMFFDAVVAGLGLEQGDFRLVQLLGQRGEPPGDHIFAFDGHC